MATIRLGENGDCSNLLPLDHDNFRELEIPSDSHGSVDTFGEPALSPRIGDEYQAILPPLIQSLSTKSLKSESKPHHTNQNFLIGLPIMLMWISTSKTLLSGPQSRSKTGSNAHSKFIKEETAQELHDLPTAEKIRESGDRGYLLVSGLAEVCWNALEKESLLLGLYIFEKNFINVRRFVETKEMGDVLSFYYGNFYGSHEYHRWSDCRKAKGKKGIYGGRIFLGLKQQEVLNRILPHIPEESRDAILEMSKSFEDEKISLTEYVIYLKNTVGVKILVDAVGIGKGKLGLTEMPIEPSRPAFPAGRAFSSLTTDEVIEILTGSYRLSKAKSNDIFWEAVWPRLLERGWQTVVPGKQTGLARPYLVYLVPGVKKFSRRKLVKGEHYFDSSTDILAQVSKQPDLIVLDSERREESIEIIGEEKSEKHCYLQPRTPKRDANVMKFMVVDTSQSQGNIRELRPLPPEILDSFAARDVGDDDTSEEITGGYNPVSDLKRKKVSREASRSKKVRKSQKSKRSVKRCRMLEGTDKGTGGGGKDSFDLNLPKEAERAIAGKSIYLSSNPLRFSTRTRPLTRKVIEAVEGGYLSRRRGRAATVWHLSA